MLTAHAAGCRYSFFPRLRATADLLMMPKEVLIDRSIRAEVLPGLSLRRICTLLERFQPDDFSADPLPRGQHHSVLGTCAASGYRGCCCKAQRSPAILLLSYLGRCCIVEADGGCVSVCTELGWVWYKSHVAANGARCIVSADCLGVCLSSKALLCRDTGDGTSDGLLQR